MSETAPSGLDVSGTPDGVTLVAYASKRGSTREVAEAVARELRARGLRVELKPAAQVGDVDHYSAVVLGGALYMGRWHKDASRFVQHHERALSVRPVAVFAMGPRTLEPKDVQGSRDQLERALEAAPAVLPFTVEIFGGAVDPDKLRFPFNRMPRSDARDWKAIAAWAREVADHLTAAVPA